MIANALDLIKDELKFYLDNKLGVGNLVEVFLNNISGIENNGLNLEKKIILTLVNVEEESVYKNVKTSRANNYTGRTEYLNPPVYLNLYLLISSTVSTTSTGDEYFKALNHLSLIVQFFQNKRCFTVHNSPNSVVANQSDQSAINDMKIIMDLYTLTFEQLNHLWGSLGGKQLPAVMYKCRLVEIKEEQVQRGGGLITEIQSTEQIY